MSSGFTGDFFYGGGRPSMAAIGGNQGGVSPYTIQQHHQQQQHGMLSTDQIPQRRADLLMGKRSFADFQQFNVFQQQHKQQQQQQPPLSLLLQQQYLLRSVKQRSNNFVSSPISNLSSSSLDFFPTNNSLSHHHFNNNNNNNNNINNISSSNISLSSPRFGVPVYQQLRSNQQQLPISLLNHHSHNFNPNSLIQPCEITTTSTTTNNNNFTTFNGNLFNPTLNRPTLSNPNPVQPNPEPDKNKILHTLHELEQQLLNDDDDNNNIITTQEEGDPDSVITNSEWSETFHNLMGSDPNPAQSSTSGSNNNVSITSNNNVNNNVMISPSPTSSTSSCCSTSASPAPEPPHKVVAEAALAISDGKIESSMDILGKLQQVANPKGSSEQRLAFYMSHALRSRACGSENPPSIVELFGKEQVSAMNNLHELSPCFKMGLLVANNVMLETMVNALHECMRIHVIDFHVGNGGQYAYLLRALRERVGCAEILVRITYVETELGGGIDGVERVKDALMMVAERVGVDLRFERVSRKIGELTRDSLGCDDGEALVVNFAYWLYRVPDESVSIENLRDVLLRRVKGLSPCAVTLVEQELNANTAPFVTRVNEACGYYGALLDSLESTCPRDDLKRAQIEEGLGRKVANVVACEGSDRVERAEMFGKWRARMGMAGFEPKAMGHSVAESMRVKLNSARGGNPGFIVREENDGVGFGWKERILTFTSAWR